MSVTTDYFFNYDKPLKELANDINVTLGCNLSEYENNDKDFFCRFMSLELSLSENCFENDGQIDFEKFKYNIGFRTVWSENLLRPIQLFLTVIVIYTLYQRLKIKSGILVYDCQTLLSSYTEKDNAFFDEISSSFVEFPQYFEIINRKILQKTTD